MNIENPKSLADGPRDGVMGITKCIRTDFLINEEEKDTFKQMPLSEAHITASVDIGTFGIKDMATGTMLSVSLVDALEIMTEALNAAKALEEIEGNVEQTE